jgi:hypothetical protein
MVPDDMPGLLQGFSEWLPVVVGHIKELKRAVPQMPGLYEVSSHVDALVCCRVLKQGCCGQGGQIGQHAAGTAQLLYSSHKHEGCGAADTCTPYIFDESFDGCL